MKKWRKGDKGWITYKYTEASATVVPVKVARTQDRRGYVSVAVPSIFGGEETFNCVCWWNQIYETEEAAKGRRLTAC